MSVSIVDNIVTSDFIGDKYLFNIGTWSVVDINNTKALVPDNSKKQSSSSEIQFTVGCSNIEINYRISSESSDYFYIFIDDVQVVKVSGYDSNGAEFLKTFTKDLTYGFHKIKFKYTKDSSADKGRDRCEIYSIKLTIQNQEKYLIKDGTKIKTIPSDIDISTMTSLSEVGAYPVTIDMYSKAFTREQLNYIINKKELYENNPTIIAITDISYVISPKIIKKRKSVSELIEQKSSIDMSDSFITGIQSINVITNEDISMVQDNIKMIVSNDDGLTWKSWSGTEWATISKSVGSIYTDGMSVDLINNLTSEQLVGIFDTNRKLKFAWIFKYTEYKIGINEIKIVYISP